MAVMKCILSVVVFVFICLEGAIPALVEMTTNNIYNTYIEMVDNNFDISDVQSFSFEVRVCNDAFVGLAETYGTTGSNFYEVLIAGYGASRLAVRDGVSFPLEVYHDDPSLVDCDKFKPFWVSWVGGSISVGSGLIPGVSELIRWDDPDPHPVNYALISSGFGAVGQWKFYNIDGGWSEWGAWSKCVRQPGGQLMDQRVRECNDPPPELGGGCTGNGTDLEPCTTGTFWYLLRSNTKVELGDHSTHQVRSRIDCCRACQQTLGCEGISYDTTSSTCFMTNVDPPVESLIVAPLWETWVMK